MVAGRAPIRRHRLATVGTWRPDRGPENCPNSPSRCRAKAARRVCTIRRSLGPERHPAKRQHQFGRQYQFHGYVVIAGAVGRWDGENQPADRPEDIYPGDVVAVHVLGLIYQAITINHAAAPLVKAVARFAVRK